MGATSSPPSVGNAAPPMQPQGRLSPKSLISDQKLSRLVTACEWSRRRLEPFRRHRLSALKEFVGFHYSDGSDERVPVNMIKLAAKIYMRKLLPHMPRVTVNTKNPQIKAACMGMENWVNKQIIQMDLEQTLRMFALDGIFSMGICAVGLCLVGYVEYDSVLHQYGKPFVECIDLDDWVHDMQCKRWDHIGYAGYRTRCPMSSIVGNDFYDQDLVKKFVSPIYKNLTNESGDRRIETLSSNYGLSNQDYEDYTELWQMWLPRENLMVTLPSDGWRITGKPIKVMEWTGSKKGPFHRLGFDDVPGNTMPGSPIQDIRDLHDVYNSLILKLGRQAERQKVVLAVGGGADADGNRIVGVEDGKAIRVDRPDQVKEMRFGGPDQQNVIFATQIRSMLSYQGGNLETMGGLENQAPTLGQENLLASGSSAMIQSMQNDMMKATKSIIVSLCEYWWLDPLQSYQADVPIPHVPDLSARINVTPEMRQATSEMPDFDIDVYSAEYQTPKQKLGNLVQTIQTVIMPLMPFIQQQGGTINVKTLVQLAAKYTNNDDLMDVVQFQDMETMMAMQQAQGGQPQGQGGGGGMAPNTTRTYQRVNSTSPESANQNMMTQMLQQGSGNGEQ